MTDLRASADAVLLAAFRGPDLPDWVRARLDAGLGGVCLFGSNVDPSARDRLTTLTGGIHAANPAAVVAIDEEGGDVTRLYAASGSPYPGNAALGVLDDVDVTRRLAASIGAELRAVGVDVDLAPSVDVNSNPRNPVIGVRSFGAHADLVARHGVAAVEGLQSAGVAACVKHFPGHGDTMQDSHVALPTVAVDEATLRARELVPFVATIVAGAAAVMTSHVVLAAFDDVPATFSRRILTDLLKGELGFEGTVVTDALDMAGSAGTAGSIPAAAVRTLAAGADLLCIGGDTVVDDALVEAVARAVVAAVEDGTLPEGRLHDARERVGRLAGRVAAEAVVDHALAEEVAARSIVVHGRLDGTRGAVVATLRTGPNIAAGHVPWGPGHALSAYDPTASLVDLHPGDAPAEVLSLAAGRGLVVVVRGQDAWTRDVVSSTAAQRPDLVVVDMGWPWVRSVLPGDATVVETHGASQSLGSATARLLAGA